MLEVAAEAKHDGGGLKVERERYYGADKERRKEEEGESE